MSRDKHEQRVRRNANNDAPDKRLGLVSHEEDENSCYERNRRRPDPGAQSLGLEEIIRYKRGKRRRWDEVKQTHGAVGQLSPLERKDGHHTADEHGDRASKHDDGEVGPAHVRPFRFVALEYT